VSTSGDRRIFARAVAKRSKIELIYLAIKLALNSLSKSQRKSYKFNRFVARAVAKRSNNRVDLLENKTYLK
jgi:hypothetical protein